MNLDIQEEIDAENIDVEINDTSAKLMPSVTMKGAQKIQSESSVGDGEDEADFEVGEAPGMFDQKEKAYESGMSARKIDLTGAQESHRSMNAGKSIAKTGSIGSMLAPVIDVDDGLQSNFATIYTNDQMNKGQDEPTKKGMDIAKGLLENYERNYMKKFPFEKFWPFCCRSSWS